jgi:hypothetical protein
MIFTTGSDTNASRVSGFEKRNTSYLRQHVKQQHARQQHAYVLSSSCCSTEHGLHRHSRASQVLKVGKSPVTVQLEEAGDIISTQPSSNPAATFQPQPHRINARQRVHMSTEVAFNIASAPSPLQHANTATCRPIQVEGVAPRATGPWSHTRVVLAPGHKRHLQHQLNQALLRA